MQLVVDGREYNMPTEFTVGKWIEIQNWTGNTDKALSVAIGLPLDIIKRMPEKTKQLADALITVALYPSWSDKPYPGLISFDNMTLGQFIDLEVFVHRGYNKHIKEIINTLHNIKVSDNDLFTPFWPNIEAYFNWRILLYSKYKNLFNISDEDKEVDEDIQDAKIDAAYAWYDVIMVLAEGKFLNIDTVLDKPVTAAFNWLAWNKTQKEKEKELLKMQQAQNKLR